MSVIQKTIHVLRLRAIARFLHDITMLQLRRSHLLARCWLGLCVPADVNAVLWDYTTLLFPKTLRRYAVRDQRIWDVGCGVVAALAQFSLRHDPQYVIASDADPLCVSTSAAATEKTSTIEVVESDFAANIDEVFDLVLFNAPYLPMSNQERLSQARLLEESDTRRYATRFGGGQDGLDAVTRFLGDRGVRSVLDDGALIMLGFNRFYVSGCNIRRIAEMHGFRYVDQVTSWWNPAAVYVLSVSSGLRRGDMSDEPQASLELDGR